MDVKQSNYFASPEDKPNLDQMIKTQPLNQHSGIGNPLQQQNYSSDTFNPHESPVRHP